MHRFLVLLVPAAMLACGGGGGGPTAPQTPSVSGVYSGTNEVVTNTCTGETGTVLGVRSVSVTQTGSSIRITLAGYVLNGTIESSGAFTASTVTVIEGVNVQVNMDGSFNGNRMLATERGAFSVPGDQCTVIISFNMTKEP